MVYSKGMITQQLVLIIILLVSAVVLFAATSSFTNIFKNKSDIEVCRLSVLAQEQTKFIGKSVVSLDCPRRDVKFFNDKVEINTKKAKEYSFKEINEDIVNRAIANELSSCWYKIGEGNVDVFEREYIAGLNNVCLICAEIKFSKEIKESTFKNLDQYLKDNTLENSDITYHDYLVKEQRDRYISIPGLGALPWTQYIPNGFGTTSLIEDEGFNTNKHYVIYFLAFKPDWFNEKLVKAYSSAYYIGLAEPSKLSKVCNLLIN